MADSTQIDRVGAHFKVVRRYLDLSKTGTRLRLVPAGPGHPAAFDGHISIDGFTHASVFGRAISGTAWSAGIAAIRGGIAMEVPRELAVPQTLIAATPLIRGIVVDGDAILDLITTTAETGVELAIDVYLYGRKNA